MISVTEARQLIFINTPVATPVSLPLLEAGNLVLAADLVSPISVPPFDQSAMDGYAFNYAEWKKGSPLLISGEIAAGDTPKKDWQKHQAARIFTGASVPKEYNTVVMQEKVKVENGYLIIQDDQIKQGMNIRGRGSQTQNGDLALKAGSFISPAAAGFIASLGIPRVLVLPAPNICIISTGKELTEPGKTLEEGKIFESNSYSLNAALREMGIPPKYILRVGDDEAATSRIIADHLLKCDVMILSGGISVGDHDFVQRALQTNGVNEIFHKVKQKPGKPLYFGKKNHTLIFGLPGNPAALLTCFYLYIRPCLQQIMGNESSKFRHKHLQLGGDYQKKPGLTQFLKGRTSGNEVQILPGQESYLMNSFTEANCLIELPETGSDFKKGDVVDVHPL